MYCDGRELKDNGVYIKYKEQMQRTKKKNKMNKYKNKCFI